MQVKELIGEMFPCSYETLCIGGLRADEIAEKFGTPLFVYDESVLQRKWDLLRSTFPQRFHIHYSVKANPNPHMLRFFLEQGAGLEVASAGELYLALGTGCPPDRKSTRLNSSHLR